VSSTEGKRLLNWTGEHFLVNQVEIDFLRNFYYCKGVFNPVIDEGKG